MADYFGNRYWAEKYWATRYYQGSGTPPSEFISATLSGAATVNATISVAEPVARPSSGGGAIRYTRRSRRVAAPLHAAPLNVRIAARIGGSATMSGEISAVAVASAHVIGAATVSADGLAIDRYAAEAEFWLLAA